MGIEDFKRWHWIVISLLVAGAIVYARLQIAPDDADVYRRGISPAEFVGLLQAGKTSNGTALITDINIYPPVEVMNDQTKKIEKKMYVTGMNLEPTRAGKAMYKQFQFTADVPFKLMNSRTTVPPDFTVRDFLDQMKKTYPDVKYSYAWWTEPKAVAALWGGGTILLIGGVWPTIVNLMIGAGFGRKREPKSDYDLDRFGKGYKRQTGPEPKLAKPVLSAADKDKLTAMNVALEKDLATSGLGATSTAAATATETQPVRKLSGGPVEVAVGTDKAPEEHDYRGEFYPVDRHIEKHDPPAKH